MAKKLSSLLENINVLELRGSADTIVTGLCYDSRSIAPGNAFFATDGIHNDGHEFIPAAISGGASVIFHQEQLDKYNESVSYVRVQNPRRSISPAAAAFYDHPSGELKTIGVTGTDGKTSTVYFIYQLLTLLGKKAGFLSTAMVSSGETIESNPFRQSTPEASEIHRILREMADNGCEYAVVEATSHGLSEKNNRLGDVRFQGGVLTNVTHEHLEFHGTMEQYIHDKANLFRVLDSRVDTGFAVINSDDAASPQFIQASAAPVSTYSIQSKSADFYAEDIRETLTSIQFTLMHRGSSQTVEINIPGLFNVENIIASVAAVHFLTGIPVGEITAHIPRIESVKGRMSVIRRNQSFSVIVDYAHSPGSFSKLFPPLREKTGGKIITVFGSAGERDKTKRSIQGEIASQYSDILVLADEDPRKEDALSILEDIAAGCREKTRDFDLFLIPDRREAISKAFSLAGPDDLVLLLGKGHESSIIYADGPVPWDECAVANELLEPYGK